MSSSSKTSTVPIPSSSSSSNAPQLTVISRVAGIPLIGYSIQQLSRVLSTNPYTAPPYSTVKGLSASASKYAAPLQVRLGPVIEFTDSCANKGLDVMEGIYPYPFKAEPEEVARYMTERRQGAEEYVAKSRENVTKTLDQKVKSPAISAAVGIDQSFTPIVDYLESTARTHLNASSAPADTQYQYQRVYVLSKNVTVQLYDYSNQTVLVQRASQTAESITALASSANCRIHTLSDSLLAELQRVQTSLVSTGASVQHSTTAASRELGDTIAALRTIITTPDLPINEKVARVTAEVQGRVQPLLDRLLNARTPPAPARSNGNGHVQ